MIPEIDIWRARQRMLKRYGGKALEQNAVGADTLVPPATKNGTAVWHLITAAVAQLANKPRPAECTDDFGKRSARLVTFTPSPLTKLCLGVPSS